MKESTDGFWGTPAQQKVMILKTNAEGLSVNGKIIPWRFCKQVESVHTELFGTLKSNKKFEKKVFKGVAQLVSRSIVGIYLTHEYPDAQNPITFIPANPQNWFDEFQKHSVTIKDELGVRHQKSNQGYAILKFAAMLLLLFGLGTLLFGLFFLALESDNPVINTLIDVYHSVFSEQLPAIPIEP